MTGGPLVIHILWYTQCDRNQSSDPYWPRLGKALPHLSLSTHCLKCVPFSFCPERIRPFFFRPFALFSAGAAFQYCCCVLTQWRLKVIVFQILYVDPFFLGWGFFTFFLFSLRLYVSLQLNPQLRERQRKRAREIFFFYVIFFIAQFDLVFNISN